MTAKRKLIRDYPVLKGLVDCSGKVRTISVWCPFCKDFHTHGWPDDSWHTKRYGSHRVAHCHNMDSPFRPGGYYAKEYTKTEKAQIFDTLSLEQI